MHIVTSTVARRYTLHYYQQQIDEVSTRYLSHITIPPGSFHIPLNTKLCGQDFTRPGQLFSEVFHSVYLKIDDPITPDEETEGFCLSVRHNKLDANPAAEDRACSRRYGITP